MKASSNTLGSVLQSGGAQSRQTCVSACHATRSLLQTRPCRQPYRACVAAVESRTACRAASGSAASASAPVVDTLSAPQTSGSPRREVEKGGVYEGDVIPKSRPEAAQKKTEWESGRDYSFAGTWTWRGHSIRYQRCGSDGPPVLLIHGFGGNCDHWRKNIPVLGKTSRVFALDLLGYGYSDKPDPRSQAPNAIYNFENWGQQAVDFISEMISKPTLVICNSVGGLVGLQAAQLGPSLIPAVQVHNISLRMLHITKQTRLQKLFIARLQKVLRETRIGVSFFGAVAKPKAVRNVLRECYGNKDAVTDELVAAILKPGQQPGAAQVFLDFISYSGGPLPEDLIKDAPCPVSILWGDKDPWEKVEWGREFKQYDTVEEFVELPGVGHCPMDEAPHLVNEKMLAFIGRHS